MILPVRWRRFLSYSFFSMCLRRPGIENLERREEKRRTEGRREDDDDDDDGGRVNLLSLSLSPLSRLLLSACLWRGDCVSLFSGHHLCCYYRLSRRLY